MPAACASARPPLSPFTAIDKTSGLLRVVGKGNKERIVPVPKPVHESLRRMWSAQDHRDRRWLFPNRRRTGPVATHVLVRTFADAVKADLPGERRATPHTLRHNSERRIIPSPPWDNFTLVHHQ